MGVYTISNCFLSNLSKNYYIIPFTFTDPLSFRKVSIDNHGKIYDLYKKSADHNEILSTWLVMMSNEPSSFQKIKIDENVTNDEVFLEVCKNTAGSKNIIINSHEEWKEKVLINNEFKANYKNSEITFLDKDQALKDLSNFNNKIEINQVNVASNVANDSSKIENSKTNFSLKNLGYSIFEILKKIKK